MEKKNQLVAGAVMLRNGRVFAAQRAGGPHMGGWEFPGGKAEMGETGAEAVVREIREELSAQVRPIRCIGSVTWETCDKVMTLECFLCELTGELKLLEHMDGRWLTAEEIDSVPWLPADREILPKVIAEMKKA